MSQNTPNNPWQLWKEAMHTVVDLSGGRADLEDTPPKWEGAQEKEQYFPVQIGSESLLEGGMTCQEDVLFLGELQGSLSTTGQLEMRGRAKGNLSGKDICLKGAWVEGEIHASQLLQIDQNSVVTGDLYCDRCVIEGKVQGNIYADSWVTLGEGSRLYGDISSGGFTMGQTARLSGVIRLRAPEEEE